MLMKALRATFHGITSQIQPAAAVTIILGQRAVANEAGISEPEMQTKRRRSPFKAQANSAKYVSGWTERTW